MTGPGGDLFREASELFDQAIELEPSERASWIERSCRGDASLRREVESLLRAHERSGVLERALDALASAVADELPTMPDRIGPFEPVEELGRGGMGVVYKARDPRLDRFVAVKLLPPVLQDDEEARRRLLREARASSRLDHPNICTIFDVGETEDALAFVAMAYYAGKTLADWIEDGPLPVPLAVDLAAQIADGLEHAHESGIVHRDVKPSNVIVTDKGVAKILDFGIARREGGSEVTAPGVRAGTVAYMSPERIDGDAGGPATDIWSLGVVLFEMLTGRRPFGGATVAELVRSIESDEPPPLWQERPDAPDGLEAIWRRALSRDPSARYRSARDLAEALREVAAAARTTVETRLPPERTSFVGREEELRVLGALLSRARLVTLTGPAGTGKSRLAIRVAHREAARFLHGAHFVALESVSDPSLVAGRIARSLGLGDSIEPPRRRLPRVLGDKQMLLVLDNFEQVSAAATLVSELMDACPRLTFLVTSRVALRLSGEQEFPVTSLPLPPPGSASLEECLAHPGTRLFVERARAARPGLELTEVRAAAIVELCRRLDGLPLALELAAARAKLFPPETLLEKLGPRFDLLSGGSRDRPARHQTLRQAIEWSYDLLEEPEKSLFRRLGVFVGGFTLDAVERVREAEPPVAIDVVAGIEVLVEHNLLRAGEGDRFSMFGTIRSFALAKLESSPEAKAVLDAHARYFLELAEQAERELTGPHQKIWLERLDADRDNLRALLAREDVISARLGAALFRFWLARGALAEGHDRLTRLLELDAARSDERLRARLLNAAGTLAHNRGDNARARDHLEKGLELWRGLGDEAGVAIALNNLAWCACELSELEGAVRLSEEALALHRKLGDRRGMALSLNNLGWVACYRGEPREARRFHEESLALKREIGDQRSAAFTLANLAWAELIGGEIPAGMARLEEALPLIRSVDDPIITGWVLLTKGRLEKASAELDAAAGSLGEAFAFWQEGGNPSGLTWARAELADLLRRVGKGREARELAEESLRGWRAVRTAWGEAMSLLLLSTLDREGDALAHARKAFSLFEAMGSPLGTAESLEAFSAILLGANRDEEAAALLSGAEATRDALGAPLAPVDRVARSAWWRRLRERLGEERLNSAVMRGQNLSAAALVESL